MGRVETVGLPVVKRPATLAIGAAILMGGIGMTMYLTGAWQPNFPDLKTYPVRGIDVSHYRGPIDWADRRFRQNWEESGKVGIRHGALLRRMLYEFIVGSTPFKR